MPHCLYRFIAVLSLSLLSIQATVAQQRRIQNKPFIDERRFHYGFCIGFHDQGLKLENNGFVDPETGAQWLAENDRQGLGFTVGVLGEWKLNNHMALRLNPSLHFGNKHLTFLNQADGKKETQDMKSTYISLPLDLKVSAPRFNNFRPYVIGGVQPQYDLTSGKHAKIKAKPFNLMLEIGMGCDLYMPFFKLIPEIKFCFGLSNLLEKNRTDLTDPTQQVFTQSVNSATANMVVLTFYFE